MNVEYYIKEFGEIRKDWFASFEKSPHSDTINRYTRFFIEEFQKPEYLENLVFAKAEGEYSIEKITEHTYSFENLAFAKSSALNPLNNNNDIERFRRNFKNLIRKPLEEDKYNDVKERIKKADKELKYWGVSTISEIIGQCFPDDFIFFNLRNKEVAHFLKLDLKGRGKYNYYVSYQKSVEDNIKPLYKKIIWDKEVSKRYPIGIEINSFFSWIYEKYIKTKSDLITVDNEVSDILYSELDGISIKNYFFLKNIQLDNLKKSDEIYILGENGVGKTLFLQAIILATKWHTLESSDGKTSGKLRDFYQNRENGQLEIVIRGSDTNKTKDVDNEDIRTEFILSNKKNIPKKSLKNIFAYGVNRQRSNKDSKPEFLTLFGESQVLKNPIDWLTDLHNFEQKIELFRLKNRDKELPLELQKPHIPLKTIKTFIKEILIGNVKIEVDYNNVIFYENETKITIDQLADGYKSVFIWVVDLIARLSENQPNAQELKDFKGVVLIDELDLFLHVKWAQRIVSDLRRWFKGIQFIITTHSPILVLSASKDAVFYKLYKENGETKITEPIKGLSDLMLNALVTSPLFGLSSARSKVFKNVENISNDDYITFKVHQALLKRMEAEPSATEDEFMKWVEMELEKELANQNQ